MVFLNPATQSCQSEVALNRLTLFTSMSHFCTARKCQKTLTFLTCACRGVRMLGFSDVFRGIGVKRINLNDVGNEQEKY